MGLTQNIPDLLKTYQTHPQPTKLNYLIQILRNLLKTYQTCSKFNGLTQNLQKLMKWNIYFCYSCNVINNLLVLQLSRASVFPITGISYRFILLRTIEDPVAHTSPELFKYPVYHPFLQWSQTPVYHPSRALFFPIAGVSHPYILYRKKKAHQRAHFEKKNKKPGSGSYLLTHGCISCQKLTIFGRG